MNTPPQETPPKQPIRKSFLEQQRRHALVPPKSFLRSYMARIFQSGKQMIRISALGGALFLGHTTYENLTDQTQQAEAQEAGTLTDAQRLEMRNLFDRASRAYRSGNFESARSDFLRLEEMARNNSPEDTSLIRTISWNICLVEIRLTLLEFINSRTAASIALPIHERNRLRLEEILGLTAVAQIQPIRDYLIDAQTRLITIRTEYDQLIAAGNTSVITDLEDTREALTFVETNLQRIEARYAELSRPVAPVEPVESTHETDPVVLTVPPTETAPEGPEITPVRPSTHTERPWALGLGVGGAGLALVGASAATYFAITPQSTSEDQAITTAANVLFWTGVAATVGGVVIIAAVEHEVTDPTVTTTVTAGPDGAMLRVGGTF